MKKYRDKHPQPPPEMDDNELTNLIKKLCRVDSGVNVSRSGRGCIVKISMQSLSEDAKEKLRLVSGQTVEKVKITMTSKHFEITGPHTYTVDGRLQAILR